MTPNKITGPNAGGPRQFPIRTQLAARFGQFCRWLLGCISHQRKAREKCRLGTRVLTKQILEVTFRNEYLAD